MAIHIEDEASKLIAEWSAKGFNGVRFIECYMQLPLLDDFLGDGKTKEEFEEWRSGYACFVAHPDLYDEVRDSSPYTKHEVDWYGCYGDMIAEIKRRLGDDVKVSHRPGCKEFEVMRCQKH